MSHGVQQLRCVGRNTADLERACAFYRDALGFHIDDARGPPPTWTKLPGLGLVPARCAHLSLGAQQIELTELPNGAAYPAGSRACDLWFQHCAIVVNDMRAAYDRVMRHGATPITRDGPQVLPPETGSVTAFKFRDPDGHPLELIAFPTSSGDPGWHSRQGPGTTLGIDHSAISVGDVARSMRFYQLLGLHAAKHGVNRGIEQQHLDDLEEVEVDVIAMQPAAARTPHLELLGYRQPRGRASAATSVTATAADRLIWEAAAIDMLLDALDAADFGDAVVASGFIDGVTTALLRDPDGHLLVLGESTGKLA